MSNFKGNIEQIVKTVIKTLAVAGTLLKAGIIILIFATVVVSLASLWNAISDAFSKKTGEKMEETPVQYEVGVKDEDGDGVNDSDVDPYAIRIGQEQIDLMEKLLEDMGTSKNDLHLKDKYLEKIYAAEVVTKELNRSYRVVGESPQYCREDPNKYYGRVYMKFAGDNTDSVSNMCFADYDKFINYQDYECMDEPDEIIHFFSVNDKTDSLCLASTVKKYDEDGNLISSEIEINEIPYKNELLGYMMPVEFLLDLALLTENPEFVAGLPPEDSDIEKGLAEKVLKDTEIYLTVRYTETTTDKTTTYTYDVETETTTYSQKKGETGKDGSKNLENHSITTTPGTPNVTKEKIVEESPTFSVTYANTWFLKQSFTYAKIPFGLNSLDPEIKELKNGEWSETNSNTIITATEDETETVIESRSRAINRKETIEKVVSGFKYVPGVIKDPEYKVEEFLKLLSTEFDIPDTFVKQSAIGKVMDGAGVLLQMLSNSQRTQAEELIMRYILNYSSGSTLYGDVDIETLNDFFVDQMVTLSKNDIVVDTLNCDPKLILDAQKLKDAIDIRYTGQIHENLYNNINAFIEMQNTYNVNAVFAIAVTIIESSGGTNWAAIAPETHNWMSVTGSYNGQSYRNPESSNDRTWRVYPSFAEATMDFGNLIANSSYYFQHDRHSVKLIAPTYCNERWGNKVVTEMMSIYATIGIDISEQNPEDNNEGTPL